MKQVIKQDFEIDKTAENYLFYNPNWKIDRSNFIMYTSLDNSNNWNYLHDIKKDVVYYIPKKSRGCSTGVFGNFAHFKQVYNPS